MSQPAPTPPPPAPANPFADPAVAEGYEAWYGTPLGAYLEREQQRILRKALRRLPGGPVIELGAGTGRVAALLAKHERSVIAVEPAAPMRQQGQRRTEGLPVEWVDAAAESLPYADGSFAGAVIFTAMEFVTDPAATLREARRVLAPDGWLLIGYLPSLSPWGALYRRLARVGQPPWNRARLYVLSDLEAMVGRESDWAAAAGFLAPNAWPPYDEADFAGARAGNAPGLHLVAWLNAGLKSET